MVFLKIVYYFEYYIRDFNDVHYFEYGINLRYY